jgi:hypothetical protein
MTIQKTKSGKALMDHESIMKKTTEEKEEMLKQAKMVSEKIAAE